MFSLPPTLARHFQDASGRVDHQALLHTPDGTLLGMARDMAPAEREHLFQRLLNLRLSGAERMMARMAGIDVDAQRARFVRILQEAAYAEASPDPVYA